MNANWINIQEKLPKEYKLVLFAYPAEELGEGAPPATAVGYVKFRGDDSPLCITPAIGGNPTHWMDCLPENFGQDGEHPYWKFPKR